ncbi:hypothetical protein FQN54_007313 [Arachnomyces sp. PD_36]|nr:hypothetical protein FQN54_007313 [Arachnomyces sp. PD_36]
MRSIDSEESHPSIISSVLLAAGSLVAANAFLPGSKEEANDLSIVDLLRRKISNEDEAAAKSLVNLEREDGDTMLFMANSLLKAEDDGGFDRDVPPFGVTDLYEGSMKALGYYLRGNEGNSASGEAIRTLKCGWTLPVVSAELSVLCRSYSYVSF